jgi:hypothetical protein
MTLAYLAEVTHMELRSPLGARTLVTLDAYRALPEVALAGVIALPITRREAIRRRVAARRRAA